MTHAYWITIAHQVVWMAFFVIITYFELSKRLLPQKTSPIYEVAKVISSASNNLWDRIIFALNEEEKWRDANLNLNTLSEYLNSNRTYVGDAIKQNTGLTFNEYINRRRINYVIEQMKLNPEINISKLFDFVGYTQRSTAVRNFQKITGITPAEFVASIHSLLDTLFGAKLGAARRIQRGTATMNDI